MYDRAAVDAARHALVEQHTPAQGVSKMSNVKPTPEGFHTVTPHLVIKDAAKAIDFYIKAFGAKEVCRMAGPDGRSVVHAEIQIGDSIIMIGEENPQWQAKGPGMLGGTPVTLNIYSEDADALFKQAVDAGAQPTMPPENMFWGDRYGKVTDPFGHVWSIATHVEDVSPEEMNRRMAEMFSANS